MIPHYRVRPIPSFGRGKAEAVERTRSLATVDVAGRPKTLPRLWQAFYRARNRADTWSRRGFGLGALPNARMPVDSVRLDFTKPPRSRRRGFAGEILARGDAPKNCKTGSGIAPAAGVADKQLAKAKGCPAAMSLFRLPRRLLFDDNFVYHHVAAFLHVMNADFRVFPDL
jgi:hypothetical protein